MGIYGNILHQYLVKLESGKTPHKLMFGLKFKKLRRLKRFGGMVVATKNKKMFKESSAIEGLYACF
jgi:hypothetical protein